MHIRTMLRRDIPHLIELCRQLGFETDLASLSRRYAEVSAHTEHALFVALVGEQPLGFLHARASISFARDSGTEVAAIVVEESLRGKGIGRALMERAEKWAREEGFPAIFLRSNEMRTEAHKFYEVMGYEPTRSSLGYLKQL